jgi:hypothetical protein
MNWILRFLCKHEFEIVRNVYGDEIIMLNYKRSVWRCVHCRKIQLRDSLGPTDIKGD